jgi:hypothetical protein
MAKVKVLNRHDALASEGKPKGKHKVSTNAHKKGHLKISVAKKGGRKRGGSKKTLLT